MTYKLTSFMYIYIHSKHYIIINIINIGTYDDPTRIPSALSSRIVGYNCNGWIQWFVVKAGPIPTVTPDGHHFVLDASAAQQPLSD